MTVFSHFIELGTVNLSSYDYDNERELLVLGGTDGRLFRVEGSGCICCGNAWDGVTEADVVPAGSVAELAAYLFGQLAESTQEGETREASVAGIEAAVRAAARYAVPAAPLAITS